MCGTYDQGITYCDLGDEVKNKLIGWVDSDFGSDPDTRKSMTGYLMSLNGGSISCTFVRSERVLVMLRRNPQKYGRTTRHVS